jgi:hypothetical protein
LIAYFQSLGNIVKNGHCSDVCENFTKKTLSLAGLSAGKGSFKNNFSTTKWKRKFQIILMLKKLEKAIQ